MTFLPVVGHTRAGGISLNAFFVWLLYCVMLWSGCLLPELVHRTLTKADMALAEGNSPHMMATIDTQTKLQPTFYRRTC